MKYEIPIPKRITLFALDCDIEVSEKVDGEMVAGQTYGTYDAIGEGRRIKICSVATPKEISNTYLHELIEFINYQVAGGKIKHEHIVGITNGLQQIFEQMGLRFILKKD